jgi:hypothetical protein
MRDGMRRLGGRPSAARGANVAAAILLAGACEVADPILGGTTERDEDRGTEIAGSRDVGFESALFWSADGQSIYFESGSGNVSLREADPRTGSVRTLDGPRADYVDPVTAPGGGTIYFSIDRLDGRRDTYVRTETGAPVLLTDRAPGTDVLEQADGRLVMPSPDGDNVAFIVYPDSLFLFDIVTGSRRFIATHCIRVVAYSPDRASIMCRRDAEGDAGFSAVMLDSGETSDLLIMPREVARIQVVHWDEDAIRTIYRTNSRFRIQNVDRDSTRTLWNPGPGSGLRVIDFFNYSWSANGERFAFWTHECLRLSRVGNCEFGQSLLHVVDLHTNDGRTVAVAKGTRGGEQLALSPDGTEVVYVFDQKVWLQVVN